MMFILKGYLSEGFHVINITFVFNFTFVFGQLSESLKKVSDDMNTKTG